VKGFKKCCISNVVCETDGDMLWNGIEEDAMLAVNVRKRKVLTAKTDNVTGKGRQNLTYYVY
jgi:hypothetical protein